MSRLLEVGESKSETREPRIAFETDGGGNYPVWDRFITVNGKRAHYLGNVCGTCPFVFQRLEDANDKVSPQELTNLFRIGISKLEQSVTQRAMEILPAGEYKVLLLSCPPQFILPSTHGDYFCEEQVDLWGPDTGDEGGTHDPKIEYYRTETISFAPHSMLFEFIVPMFPQRYLHEETIHSYLSILERQTIPTALAVSILDVKEELESEAEMNTHWCLAHFLLDGHHKVFAASRARKPITILSFLAVDKGISLSNDIETLLTILSR